MIQQLPLMFAAIILGAVIAIYLPMNGQISQVLGSAVGANLIFYAVGLLVTGLLFALLADRAVLAKIQQIPPHLFISGVLSALMILGMTWLMPVLGPRQLFVLTIAGQVLMAMLISHLQWFGAPLDPLGWKKLLGGLLVILGVVVSVS